LAFNGANLPHPKWCNTTEKKKRIAFYNEYNTSNLVFDFLNTHCKKKYGAYKKQKKT
jgi:hypothetical protein